MPKGQLNTTLQSVGEPDSAMIEDYTVELAKKGNADAARLLLQYIADNLAENKSLAPEISKYLSKGLSKILAGENPLASLNLSSPIAKGTFDHETDFMDMVIDYWKLRESGENASVARHLIAESWGIPEPQVKRLVHSFKEAVREVMDLRKRMKSIELQAAEDTDLKTFLERINTRK